MAEQKNGVLKALLKILGRRSVDVHEAEDENESQNPLHNDMKAQFTKSELKNVQKPEQPNKGKTSDRDNEHLLHTIIEQLTTTSENIGQQVRLNSQMAGMAPEIIQARRIYTSSILSPNDMQTGRISVMVDDNNNETGLTEEQKQNISTALSDFFNDEVNLSDKLSSWIETCLFESGSQPVMTVSRDDVKCLADNVEATAEDLVDQDDFIDECIATLENDEDFKWVEDNTDHSVPDVVKQANEMIKKLNKNFGASDPPVSTTSNIRNLQNKNKNATNKVKQKMDNVIEYKQGSIYMLQSPDSYQEDDRPTIVELPAEAVIPIGLPGSKESHIGYFVLTDKWGNPMEYSPNEVSTQQMSQSHVVNKSFNTIVGESPGSLWKDMQKEQQWKAINTVFNIAVNRMMKQHLTDDNEMTLSVGQTNNISNCILYNTLRNKKMKLVFVPEPLMAYYAFDYRNDGTGKTLLEDIQGPLSLRVTLMVARVMGEIENAVNEKQVTVNLDEKNTNPEQTLDMVKDLFMKKNMLNMSNLDPSSISQDVASRSLSIVPQGLSGLEGDLQVEKQSESGNKATVDEGLMERLTNMAISGIGVPHSAVNELSETEYSRTVATVNLMFSNIIRGLQHTLTSHNNKFIRNYCHMCYHVRSMIEQYIQSNDDEESEDDEKDSEEKEEKKDDKEEKEKENKEDKEKEEKEEQSTDVEEQSLNEGDPGTTDDNKDMIANIIDHLTVDLPEPNVSTSRAQFEEVDEFISTLDTLMDELFNEEMVMGEDSMGEEDMMAMKRFVKAHVIREYLSSLSTETLNIPEMESYLDEHSCDIEKFQLALQNMKKRIQDMKDTTQAGEGEEGGGGGGGMF